MLEVRNCKAANCGFALCYTCVVLETMCLKSRKRLSTPKDPRQAGRLQKARFVNFFTGMFRGLSRRIPGVYRPHVEVYVWSARRQYGPSVGCFLKRQHYFAQVKSFGLAAKDFFQRLC